MIRFVTIATYQNVSDETVVMAPCDGGDNKDIQDGT